MPAPTIRHIATSALCAALFLGTAAPALAAPPDSARNETRATAQKRAVLQDQARALTDLGTVLTPVTTLLNRALKADDDPLTDAELKELVDEANEAIAQARKEAEQARKDALAEADAARAEARKEAEEIRKELLAEIEAAKTTPSTATPTTTPSTAPTTSTNLLGGALDGLGEAINALLGVLQLNGETEAKKEDTAAKKESTAKVETDAKAEAGAATKEVEASADNLLQALVNVAVATLLDRGLPAAQLPGLPPA